MAREMEGVPKSFRLVAHRLTAFTRNGFGESGGRLDYAGYLRLRELLALLALQQTLSEAPDELLFIVVHQVYRLLARHGTLVE
jgi:hypothetical protein